MGFEKIAVPESTWRKVLAKTAGNCTYCGKKLEAALYGRCSPVPSEDGAWEVEHWIARSAFDEPADADTLANYWPACCGCNDEKGVMSGPDYLAQRQRHGLPVGSHGLGHALWAPSKRDNQR